METQASQELAVRVCEGATLVALRRTRRTSLFFAKSADNARVLPCYASFGSCFSEMVTGSCASFLLIKFTAALYNLDRISYLSLARVI